MKDLGHSIKSDWLEKFEDEIDTEGTGFIEFEEFCDIVKRKMQEDEDERELKEIFRVLDKEKKGEVVITLFYIRTFVYQSVRLQYKFFLYFHN